MNPILPSSVFVPDAEAHVWQDGRLYLYGSLDIGGNPAYCSHDYHVFSTDDLVHWTDHGVSFSTKKDAGDFSGLVLYAPDCVEKDGRYYLYFCTHDQGEGVAVSDSPFGPFLDPVPVTGAHKDGIDPAVFKDDDGACYLYWGQFQLRGARLAPNMHEIEPDTFTANILTEETHGFHEGASIRKRNGIYYLIYTDISRGRATCLSYATSRSPLGPFEKGGVIIDNTGCDPQTWNDHGSIEEFGGQWYVFYHRSSQNSQFSRRVCVEPIFFEEDGSIKEVVMTTQGAGPSIPVGTRIPAGSACMLSGSLFITQTDTEEYLGAISNGDCAYFRYLHFTGEPTVFEAEASAKVYPGQIEIHESSPDGRLLGVCSVLPTGGWQQWQTFSCPLAPTEGNITLCLVFRGQYGKAMTVKSFLVKAGHLTP